MGRCMHEPRRARDGRNERDGGMVRGSPFEFVATSNLELRTPDRAFLACLARPAGYEYARLARASAS